MKKLFPLFWIWISISVTLIPLGCGARESDRPDHKGKETVESEEHVEDESPSGASFKPGKGVMLTDETRKILGLEIADVIEEPLNQVISLNIQIFGETHRIDNLDMDHTGCDVHGSGFLSAERAVLIESKQQVKLVTSRNEVLDGFVVKVQKQLAQGETEVIVGVTTAGTKLKDGEFVSATISVPRNEAVTVMPASALLRAAEGTFVYVVNGEAYYRTAVKLGSEANGKIEVTDGLYPGDQVVVKPVETLWIIELRATKGGGHSH